MVIRSEYDHYRTRSKLDPNPSFMNHYLSSQEPREATRKTYSDRNSKPQALHKITTLGRHPLKEFSEIPNLAVNNRFFIFLFFIIKTLISMPFNHSCHDFLQKGKGSRVDGNS